MRNFSDQNLSANVIAKSCRTVAFGIGFAVTLASLSPIATAQEAEAILTEDKAFEAVFKDPGNVLLNFTLVAAQLRNNHFKEAAGTLERILILLPDEPRAQMLLATVQLNLGNRPEAERLAKKVVDNPQANDAQKSEAELLIARLADERRLFDFSGNAAIGFGIADNPIGGSLSNLAQPKVGGDFGVNSKRATAEEFSTASVTVNLKRNLVAQMPRYLSIVGTLYTRDYATYQDGDLMTAGLTTQYSQNTQSGRYSASLGATAVNVGDQPYQNTYQLRLGYDHFFKNGVSLSVGATGARKVFKTFDTTTNTQKTGNTHTANANLAFLYEDTRFAIDTAITDVNAAEGKNEKNNYTAGLSATTLLLPGTTTARLGIARDNYRVLDTTYTNSPYYKRKDTTNSLRVTYLLGLDSLDQPNGTEPYVDLTGTYSKTKSNIANFSKYSGEFSLTLNHPL